MIRTSAFTAWTAGLFVSVAAAQVVPRKEPVQYAGTERTSRVEVRAPGIRLGLRKAREFALAPLSASESAKLAGPATRAISGVHREVPPDALLGGWEVTPEGRRVWRVTLRSPEAAGLRVQFANFSAGDGKVWLYDGDQVAGPYTGRGIYDDGRFWSATVFADSVTVEYEPAADTGGDTLPFEIASISHQVKPATRGAYTPIPEASVKDSADICHLDPNCYAEWKPAMNMVAQIAFEEDGRRYLCSGSLLATRDNSFKPYFLTAGHCIHSEASARTMEVYWTYQTASCGGTPPLSRTNGAKSTLGGHLIDWATIEQGDFSLVLLNDAPPSGVTFSGWDAADPPALTGLTGIHHPAGSWKRISFGERVGDQSVIVGDEGPAPGNRFLSVLWDKGRTEPGSSGSPLFSSPGVVVGMLSYGPFSPTATACEISPSIDGYGRFSNAYNRVKDYLENLPAALVTAENPSVAFAVANRVAPAEQAVRLITKSTGSIGFKLRSDASWIRVSGGAGNVSASAPAQINISIDPTQFDRVGRYEGTVTILSGSAPPQFINVVASAVLAQSNVVASISPSSVTASTGEWSFQIRLEETAGAATRLTGVKFNGSDYSSSINDWFGGDRIGAKGVLEAPLSGAGLFPSGLQFFEFRGVDDVSGQTWYRTATVEFR